MANYGSYTMVIGGEAMPTVCFIGVEELVKIEQATRNKSLEYPDKMVRTYADLEGFGQYSFFYKDGEMLESKEAITFIVKEKTGENIYLSPEDWLRINEQAHSKIDNEGKYYEIPYIDILVECILEEREQKDIER